MPVRVFPIDTRNGRVQRFLERPRQPPVGTVMVLRVRRLLKDLPQGWVDFHVVELRGAKSRCPQPSSDQPRCPSAQQTLQEGWKPSV